MLIVGGIIAGFISIFILTARFALTGNSNKKLLRLLSISWFVFLFMSGLLLAVDASKTYVPAVMRKIGYWVVVGTGRFVGWEYGVVKDMVGMPPVVMFILIVLAFSLCGFIFAGSIATGINMARHETRISLKIFSFLSWFFRCFFSGIITCGILPVVFAVKSKTKETISRRLMLFLNISSIVFLYCFVSRLAPRML